MAAQITAYRAKQCITHHYACDCREYRYQQMEAALKTIHTWAAYDADHGHARVLDPHDTRVLAARALGRDVGTYVEEKCAWVEDGDNWETRCGRVFTFVSGGPEDNGMRYCGYCGRKLVERGRK